MWREYITFTMYFEREVFHKLNIKIKDMKKTVKFNLLGMTFELPTHCLRTHSYSGVALLNPVISIGRKEVPLMFKQFMKEKYPTMLVWGKSSSFANGCSSDLYACHTNGDELVWGSDVYKEIASFCNMFKGGHYDGMHDSYEYAENGKTDNGTELEFNAKYVSFNGKAPYGTWPEALRFLKGAMAGEYVWGVLSVEKAIEKLKGYSYTEATITKAVSALGV
jgi:hypothetical protein